MKICSIGGCGKKVKAKGFCSAHYQMFKAYGDPNHKRKIRGKCIVPGCENECKGQGLCNKHLFRMLRHGDPLFLKRGFGPDGLKVCLACGVPKGREDFNNRSRCKDCHPKYRGECNKKNPNWRQISREGNIKTKYGLTPEDYKAILAKQGEVCEICKQPESGKHGHLSVDHNHATGKIRGLLCTDCNVGIGRLKDSIATLRSAIDYLKRSESGLE